MEKTLAEKWGPTVADKTSARLDFSMFDKPGTYQAVVLIPSGAWSQKEQKGYARDEEIKEAAREFADRLKNEQTNMSEMRAKREKHKWWAGWLDQYGTPEKVLDAIGEWEAKLEALERAKSPDEMLKVRALVSSPGMWNGKKLDFAKIGWKVATRAHAVDDAEKAGPSAILKLSGMGVVLADKPNWAEAASQTAKALAFVKGRKDKFDDVLAGKAHELIVLGTGLAEAAIKDALAKYPMADPAKMPSPQRIVPEITLSRK